MSTILLLDVETVPPPLSFAGVDAAVQRQIARSSTPIDASQAHHGLSVVPPWARLLCAAWAVDDQPVQSVGWDDLDAAALAGGDLDRYGVVERRVLDALFATANAAKPDTFGSYRMFDLHVIRGACLRHGYTHALRRLPGGPADKWCKGWLDLANGWGDHPPPMADLLAQIGLGKTEGMHGSEVYGAFLRGEVERIRKYCEGDVKGLRALARAIGVLGVE